MDGAETIREAIGMISTTSELEMVNQGDRYPLDPSLPVLVFGLGYDEFSILALAVVRTLGSAGVPVFTLSDTRWGLPSVSRYLRESIVRAPTTSPLEALLQCAGRIGKPALIVATSDAAATFVSEHAEELAGPFVFPQLPNGLAATLANKRDLYGRCTQLGIHTPASFFPVSARDVKDLSESSVFPLMVKNVDNMMNPQHPRLAQNTVVNSGAELIDLSAKWIEPYQIIVQEYIPNESAEDWIVEVYVGDNDEAIAFSGLKLRAWPPGRGFLTHGVTAANENLLEKTTALCAAIEYRGIADLDWRLDRRDGEYKLLDFNPRVGGCFRLFESEQQIDVVRAMHLDLSGRSVPSIRQKDGRYLTVELWDSLSRLAPGRPGGDPRSFDKKLRAFAYFKLNDPLPFVLMVVRFLIGVLAKPRRTLSHLLRACFPAR